MAAMTSLLVDHAAVPLASYLLTKVPPVVPVFPGSEPSVGGAGWFRRRTPDREMGSRFLVRLAIRWVCNRSTGFRRGTAISGWSGCPTHLVSSRLTDCQRGTAVSGWSGCPAPPVPSRSTGCHRGTAISGWSGRPTPPVSSPSAGCSRGFSHFRLIRLPSSSGIVPVNWLSKRDRDSRLARLPPSGIVPVNWLSKRDRVIRLPNSPG